MLPSEFNGANDLLCACISRIDVGEADLLEDSNLDEETREDEYLPRFQEMQRTEEGN
jgi:hypothetical protein